MIGLSLLGLRSLVFWTSEAKPSSEYDSSTNLLRGIRVSNDGTLKESDPSSPSALKRGISPLLLLLFVVGDMVGGGIYALVGKVAGVTGGAIWSAFLFALTSGVVYRLCLCGIGDEVSACRRGRVLRPSRVSLAVLSFMVAFAVVMSGITSASALASRSVATTWPRLLTCQRSRGDRVYLACRRHQSLWHHRIR